MFNKYLFLLCFLHIYKITNKYKEFPVYSAITVGVHDVSCLKISLSESLQKIAVSYFQCTVTVATNNNYPTFTFTSSYFALN